MIRCELFNDSCECFEMMFGTVVVSVSAQLFLYLDQRITRSSLAPMDGISVDEEKRQGGAYPLSATQSIWD